MRTATPSWQNFIAAYSAPHSKELYKGCDYHSPAEYLGKQADPESPIRLLSALLQSPPSPFSPRFSVPVLGHAGLCAVGISFQAGDGAAEQQSTGRNSAQQTSIPSCFALTWSRMRQGDACCQALAPSCTGKRSPGWV